MAPAMVLGDEIGFAQLLESKGTDLTVVNAARVSFGKRKDLLDEKDAKLIEYLAKHRHTSPFEHVTFTWLIKAPLVVARQWMRHRTFSYNEVSRRYTEENVEFFIPKTLRLQGTQEDQQQSDKDKTIGIINGMSVSNYLQDTSWRAFDEYTELLNAGVAREQARMVLPQNMYTEYYATVNLHNLMHFCSLRTSDHAQYEIKVYAEAMLKHASVVCPVSVEAIRNTWVTP